jgi:hypothetical protein
MTCPTPTHSNRLWFRISGFITVMLGLVMPYRVRILFARMLTFIMHGPGAGFAVFAKKQARFWNNIILSVVFFLGIGSAAFFKWVGRLFRSRSRKKESYWLERGTPESFIEGIKEPF